MISRVTDVKAEMTPELFDEIRSELQAQYKEFDPIFFCTTWNKLIDQKMGAVWAIQRDNNIIGATGAIASSEPVEGITVVAQAFLFLSKTNRNHADAASLLAAVEEFARERKASRVIAAVCYDTLDGTQSEFLERRGYLPYEIRYYKTVWEQKP